MNSFHSLVSQLKTVSQHECWQRSIDRNSVVLTKAFFKTTTKISSLLFRCVAFWREENHFRVHATVLLENIFSKRQDTHLLFCIGVHSSRKKNIRPATMRFYAYFIVPTLNFTERKLEPVSEEGFLQQFLTIYFLFFCKKLVLFL